MNFEIIKKEIEDGRAVIGIEFGSTRIKAVLTASDGRPAAAGSYQWENRLEDGFWTYSLEDIWIGLQTCYQSLAGDVEKKYGIHLKRAAAIGISAMMHGYMAFDSDGQLLVPFRTWRNTNTAQAAKKLTALFGCNIPQRWSIAHLYQAVLNGEEHLGRLDYMTTLAGYVHWKLSGQKVLGIGDASGMFPVDSETKNYRSDMMKSFDDIDQVHAMDMHIEKLLPKVLTAGQCAGALTEEGARLLDISGNLEPGALMCPPEGDAGTGMTATNSVAVRTGNVSAGTSVFAMVVLEKPLSKLYEAIDMVTTPSGEPVAMVHCNNCTSDINAWAGLFDEVLAAFGLNVDQNLLFETLYQKAASGEKDGGGLLSYGYYSGEPVTGFESGCPLFVRSPQGRLNLANFMRTHIYGALGALSTGMEILFDEHVGIDRMTGHGGLFKTPMIGQQIMSAAVKAPVTVMQTAGEGGAWGIGLLALYMLDAAGEESLDTYLNRKIFSDTDGVTVTASVEERLGFDAFMRSYKKGLAIERAAVETKWQDKTLKEC